MMGATRSRWFRAGSFATLLLATQFTRLASAGSIDKIRADQTVRVAYRDDARPFSYKEPNGAEPTGYVMNLCKAVAKHLADQLGVPSLKVVYVPVTAANRFE